MAEFNECSSQVGIVIHDKKPFVSKTGVFLEFYGLGCKAWDTRKACQYIGCLFEVLKSSDIARAKEVFACLCLEVPKELGRWLSYALSKIIDYWGYEFTESECVMPFEAGGWTYRIEEGYNSFFYDAQLLEDSKEMCALVGLCSMRSPPKRVLKLHKEHSDYISDLVNMGWADDPSKLSWEMIAKGSLLLDYKSSSEVVKIRKTLLLKRAQTYAKRLKSKNTEYHEIKEFWKQVDKFGWYLPPIFAIERRDSPQWHIAKKPPKYDGFFKSTSSSRLYYHLTKLRGSKIDVCIPNDGPVTHCDIAASLLYRLSGGHHRTLHECVYALETGYDLEQTYKRLQDKLGGFFVFREEVSPCTALIELFNEAMGSCHGNVFPWHERGQSFLTKVSPSDMELNRFNSMPEGVALYFSMADTGSSDPACCEGNLYIQIRELQEEFDKSARRGGSYRPSRPNAPASRKDLNADEIQQLAYYTSMMKGALGHLVMAFGEHTVASITHPGVESYTSVFDDEDEEGLGDLFL